MAKTQKSYEIQLRYSRKGEVEREEREEDKKKQSPADEESMAEIFSFELDGKINPVVISTHHMDSTNKQGLKRLHSFEINEKLSTNM